MVNLGFYPSLAIIIWKKKSQNFYVMNDIETNEINTLSINNKAYKTIAYNNLRQAPVTKTQIKISICHFLKSEHYLVGSYYKPSAIFNF